MALKLLIFAGVALAVWLGARRALGGGNRKPKPRIKAEDFTRCPDCGAWISRGEPCDCGRKGE